MSFQIVDASGFVHRMFWGLPPLTRRSDMHPINVAQGCVSSFWGLVRQNPSHVAVALDSGKKSSARLAISAEYKAQRKPLPEDLICQMPFAREAAEAFGFRCVMVDGVEADDLIATLARIATEQGHEVIILSGDKDMCQLVSPTVTLFDPLKKIRITQEIVRERYGVPPRMMIDYQAMCGDDTDNVKGIKGVGPKFAQILLRQFGSLEAILERCHEIETDHLRAKVSAGAEQARVAKRLVTLDPNIEIGCECADFAYPSFDHRPVLEFLDRMQDLGTLRGKIASAYAEAA